MKVPKARKLPSGMWFIQLRLGGESISITERTEKKCTAKAALIKAEHITGRRPGKTEAGEKTLREIITEYIDSLRATRSPSTIRGYVQICNSRFKSYLDKPVGYIKDWQRVVNEESQLCGEKTLKNAWGLVRPALKKAHIPVPDVKLPMIPEHETPWLTPEELSPFIRESLKTCAAIPLLVTMHGLRQSEVLALKWEDIDLKKGTMYVHTAAVRNDKNELTYKQTPKTKESNRHVPILIPALKDLLMEQSAAPHAKTDLVSPDITQGKLYYWVKKTSQTAGVTVISPHGLRHSFASLCYHLGISEKATMRFGGWSDIAVMRKIYTKLSEKDMSDEKQKLIDFFDKC